tara:strand:+ start:209 stop:373 length:165 start_codon:yes stop_codon:yes gene_type:complete
MSKHPEASAVVDLVRLFAYKEGKFNLVDIPQKEAKKKRLELTREGFVITHTEFL